MGGIFDMLSTLVRRGLGGMNGNGRQMVSWVHGEDFVRAVEFLIAREEFSGVANVASPHPVPNREFMRNCGRPGVFLWASGACVAYRDRCFLDADGVGAGA